MIRSIAISLILAVLVATCFADESIIEYAGIQKAQNLAGVIRDGLRAPIPEVAVEEMSDDWTKVLQRTTTDKEGRWSLSVLQERRIHNIRFMKNAIHQLRVRVSLTHRAAKPLEFLLPVS